MPLKDVKGSVNKIMNQVRKLEFLVERYREILILNKINPDTGIPFKNKEEINEFYTNALEKETGDKQRKPMSISSIMDMLSIMIDELESHGYTPTPTQIQAHAELLDRTNDPGYFDFDQEWMNSRTVK